MSPCVEDCAAHASDPRFARVDYALFLVRCFPDEAAELGVMSLEDRRIQAAVTQVESIHLGRGGDVWGENDEGGESGVRRREEGSAGSYHGGGAGVAHGEATGMRVGAERASRSAVGTPSGMAIGRHAPRGKDGFLRHSTDVTFVSLDGVPCSKIPSELRREPPLNIFHGRGMEKPARPLAMVPLHEQALRALRLKVKERVSIRNAGSGLYTLRKTLLTSFVDPPATLTAPMFERALISMNLNMTQEHVDALFLFFSDAGGEVHVDAFCHQVVHGDSNADYTGGAPPEYDIRKDGPFKLPEKHHLSTTDVTFVSLDGVPCKRIPPELSREPPLNVLNGEGSGATGVRGDR